MARLFELSWTLLFSGQVRGVRFALRFALGHCEALNPLGCGHRALVFVVFFPRLSPLLFCIIVCAFVDLRASTSIRRSPARVAVGGVCPLAIAGGNTVEHRLRDCRKVAAGGGRKREGSVTAVSTFSVWAAER